MAKRRRPRTLQVLSKRCGECLFSSARIVSAARKAEVLRDCARSDRHFVCHKAGGNVGCRGFYDVCPSTAQQVLGRLGMLEFVDEKSLV
jgi:hypothetical protein